VFTTEVEECKEYKHTVPELKVCFDFAKGPLQKKEMRRSDPVGEMDFTKPIMVPEIKVQFDLK